MRALIFVLFVLAVGKVGLNSYIHRQSTETAVISAYRENALAACGAQSHWQGAVQSRRSARRQRYESTSQPADPGASEVQLELVIGQSDLNVRLWQTSHSKWATRYTDPFVRVIAPGPHGPTVCDYDINNARVYAVTKTPPPQPPRQNG